MLETLDARVVPAVFDWTGNYSTDAGDSRNWDSTAGPGALPGNGDELSFGLQAPPPGSPPTPPVSCNNLTLPSTDSFAAIHILDGYAATITFGSAITTAALDMADGAISQPSSGRDLTITGSLTWTGGALNSSGNLATVTVTGSTATALVAPANGGTVVSGSTINLSNGAVATMNAGGLEMKNDAVLNINENCGLLVEPGTGNIATVKVETVNVTVIEIKTGAWLKVNSGQFGNATNPIPLENTGGSFILESGTRAVFGGVNDYCYVQSAGATYIAADATLVAGTFFGAKFSGGLLSIKAGTQPQNFEGHIVGDLTITGGDIRFESLIGGDNHEFGAFIVDGDVFWEGGTYHPYVSADSNNTSDVWHVTKTLSISPTTPVVDVTAVDGENNVVTPDSNMHWHLFTSDTGISFGDPSLTSGYTFDKDMNAPRKWWDLKKN